MRIFTTFAIIAVVGSVIGAGIAIAVLTEDSREAYQEVQDDYDIDGYMGALEDKGFIVWNPGRLWPGSIDPMLSMTNFTSLGDALGL